MLICLISMPNASDLLSEDLHNAFPITWTSTAVGPQMFGCLPKRFLHRLNSF